MAYELKSVKPLNAYKITTNGKNSDETYRKFKKFLETHQHFVESDYVTYFPLNTIQEWMSNFSYITTMTETLASILDNEKILVPDFPIIDIHSDKMKLEPFPFQKAGINFLIHIKKGIIGDEMGLGKTVSSLGAFNYLYQEGKVSKFLVICPSSVKFQWASEIEKFTDFTPTIINGTPKKRVKLLNEFKESDSQLLLINYELVQTELELLKSLPIDGIIVDEAHRLKNRDTKTFKAVEQLDAEFKFALTGTPLQNKPEEAFALMSWLNPDVFGGITQFKKRHIIIGEKFGRKFVNLGYKNLDEIRDRLSPHLLRRLKIDVADDLPDIIHSVSYSEMTAPQKAVYLAIEDDKKALEEEINEDYKTNPKAQTDPNFVSEKEKGLNGFRYMQIAISDHPHLLLSGKSAMAKKYFPLLKKCKNSPKMDDLFSMIAPLIEDGHKIVIFSQFVSMIKLLVERYQATYGYAPYVIEGSVDSQERAKIIERFRSHDDIQVMFCSDAANYGINLQFASTLINYDLPWNPSVLDQRYGRIHRIGSTNDVVTFVDMATKDTIDERILKTLENKRGLNEELVERTDEEREILMKQIQGVI